MFAGLAIGPRRRRRRPGRGGSRSRSSAWGLAHAALGVSGEPLVLGLLLLVAGATIAPTFVSANGMLDDLAPAGHAHRGLHVDLDRDRRSASPPAAAVAGALVEAASPALAMAVLGGGGVLAGLVVRAAAAGPLRAAAPAPA